MQKNEIKNSSLNVQKMKPEMYKYLDKEYHYLQKQDRIVNKIQQDSKIQKPENVKIIDQLERC